MRREVLPPLSDTAKKLMRRHLGRAGQIASLQIPRANLVHWEIFSEDPVFGMEQRSADGSLRDGIDPESTDVVPIWWQRAEDPDDDLAIDSEQVLEALEEVQELKNERFPWLPSSYGEDYGELTQEEVLRFYMNGYGARLQTCACRFHTAWGLPDAETTATEAGWDVAATQALQWWEDVAGRVDGFPATKHVWHYPPIEALRAVQWETERHETTFHVEIGGKRHAVERFEDIRDLVYAHHGVPESHAEVTLPVLVRETAARIITLPEDDSALEVQTSLHHVDVEIERPEAEPAYFARTHAKANSHYAGIYNFAGRRPDTPDLYEMLIDRVFRDDESMTAEEEGLPDLSEFDRNVWAAISESEGHLTAINTWDSAFVTVGPVQQTVWLSRREGRTTRCLAHASGERRGCLRAPRRAIRTHRARRRYPLRGEKGPHVFGRRTS